MNVFRRETYLAPGDPTGPDGFRPTTERVRITHNPNRLDTWGDRALWAGVALATAMTASLTAWSAAELLARPYGHAPGSNVWLLGLGLGLVADILWLIMLLLVRRARAILRTNPAADKAGWGFAVVSVGLIAGHALVDGAGTKDWDDIVDVWTITLLLFALFPILTKILWAVLLDTFYLKPDSALAEQLDKEARKILADKISQNAREDFKRQQMLMLAARKQFAEELGIPFDELDDGKSRPRVELSRTDRDSETAQDTRQDAETRQGETAGQDTAPATPQRDIRTFAPPRPAAPPVTPSLGQPASITPAAEQQDTTEHGSRSTVSPRPVRAGQPSIRDTVLAALNEGIPETDDQALRARVEEVHGPIREKAADGEVKAGSYRKGRARAIDAWHKRTGEGQYA